MNVRLYVPGIVDPEDAFTCVVDAPLGVGPLDSSQFHEYAFVRNPAARQARRVIDGRLAYEARDVDVPTSVRVGFGLFTLHQVKDGQSVSLKGQGMTGQWRNFRVPA